MYQPDVNELVRLYSRQQTGGGGLDDNLLFYKSSYKRQRGGGLGSIFGTIARTLLPFAKKLLPAAKTYLFPHAKKAALGIADDVLAGKNFKSSFKEHGKKAINTAIHDALDQSGSGARKKRRKKKILLSKKPKLSTKSRKKKTSKPTLLAIKAPCRQKARKLRL